LLELGALRPVLFFTWNSRSYAERWARRAGMAGMALVRPFMYGANRTFATRFLHTLLRGVSRDRLDLLGEEYFQYVLKPQMRRTAVDKLVEAIRCGERVVLVSQLLDHILKPLAKHFGIESIVANRLDFRYGIATGRLLDPVVRPRGPLAWVERVDCRKGQCKVARVRELLPTRRWRCLARARASKNFRCAARWRIATSC